jgi:hypothetical protein
VTTGFRHIVLFRLHDDVTDAEADAALDVLKKAGDAAGVLQWRVTESEDRRKGRIVVENALFADRDTFKNWCATAEHRRASEHLALISDWWNGDYAEDVADDRP